MLNPIHQTGFTNISPSKSNVSLVIERMKGYCHPAADSVKGQINNQMASKLGERKGASESFKINNNETINKNEPSQNIRGQIIKENYINSAQKLKLNQIDSDNLIRHPLEPGIYKSFAVKTDVPGWPSKEPVFEVNVAPPKAIDHILGRRNQGINNLPAQNREVHIEYRQSDMISNLTDGEKTLKGFNLRFGGLCELVCNRLLLDDGLGKSEIEAKAAFDDRLSIAHINKSEIKESHLIDVFGTFQKTAAFLFGLYPNNIFSILKQKKLLKKDSEGNNVLNRKIIEDKLENLPVGKYIKVEVFWKDGSNFQGHSLLIKKTGVDANGKSLYSFFDPNAGEFSGLKFNRLCEKLDEQFTIFPSNDILFMDGDVYKKQLLKKGS